jgi:hypothetical protein
MQFSLDVFASVIGDLLFACLLILVGRQWLSFKNRNIKRFFGIDKNKISIYLSNLFKASIAPHTKNGLPQDNTIISGKEFSLYENLGDFFHAQRYRSKTVWHKLAETIDIFEHTQCTIDPCPLAYTISDIDTPVMLVGSSVGNSVRASILKNLIMIFDKEQEQKPNEKKIIQNAVLIKQSESQKIRITPNKNTTSLAVIERVEIHGKVVVTVAGWDGYGTAAAVRYLMKNLNSFFKRNMSNDNNVMGKFAYCLVPTCGPEECIPIFLATERTFEKLANEVKISGTNDYTDFNIGSV